MSESFLRRLLAHPLTASLEPDDPKTTELRKQILQSKPFLRAIYDEWYGMLANEVPPGDGEVLELGSGAGYCSRFIPELITSDLFPYSDAKAVLNAQFLPFANRSLRAIVMTNVLHHIPDARLFFAEAVRCLRGGGKLLMIEPWVTPWSRFVYRWLHAEPFLPDSTGWSFKSGGPLSDANVAIPWMVFARDRTKLGAEFPELCIEQVRPFLPFRYLVSGGVSMRRLVPDFTYQVWARLEKILTTQMERLGMFAFISVRRR